MASLRAAPLAGPSTPVVARRGSLQVTNAITRQKKEMIVANINEHLESSTFAMGMRFQGVSVAEMQVSIGARSYRVCNNILMFRGLPCNA